MTHPHRTPGAVATPQAEEYEALLVQDYLRLLREDNAALREEIGGLRRVGFSASGRQVVRQVVAVVVLGCFCACWWSFSRDAAAVREWSREHAAVARMGR